jgi:hypothetical protein
MKGDVKEMKGDMKEMKADIKEMKGDVKDTRGGIKTIIVKAGRDDKGDKRLEVRPERLHGSTVPEA